MDLNTGDIILCRGDSGDDMIDKIIEDFTHSPYIHVGIIIKDPWWLKLKGIFVLQANRGPNGYPDVITKNLKKGVTLNKLNDFLAGRQFVEVRKLQNLIWNENNKKCFVKLFKPSL